MNNVCIMRALGISSAGCTIQIYNFNSGFVRHAPKRVSVAHLRDLVVPEAPPRPRWRSQSPPLPLLRPLRSAAQV